MQLRQSNINKLKDGVEYHTASDLTSQAVHLAATIKADIVKQKLPTNNGGYTTIGFGHKHDRVYSQLMREEIEILNAVPDVYLTAEVTTA